MTWVLGIASFAAAVFALVRSRYAATRRRHTELTAVTRTRLVTLTGLVRHWSGCEFDLVRHDSDRDRKSTGRRCLTLRPMQGVEWDIWIDLQERYRLGYTENDRQTWYPAQYEWSTEPWLKKAVDLLLLHIAQLPPPRTHDEWMARSNREFEARMTAHRIWMAELSARPADFPSLDDPCDDME